MEIFGIGPLELLLIVFLALIVLGPKEMIEMSKKTAGWLRKIRQSDAWKTTREVMDIPNKVMKETGLEDELREMNTVSKKVLSPVSWEGNTPSPTREENKIHKSATAIDPERSAEADQSQEPGERKNVSG